MSFADVVKMGSKEQEAVIEQVDGAKSRLKLTIYLTQVANQRIADIQMQTQAANQRIADIQMRTQAAIKR
jgi:hypothetical protein